MTEKISLKKIGQKLFRRGRKSTKKVIDKKALEEKIIATLRTIFDPEIPVNIYDLGLIYEVTVNDDATAVIRMTLTTPMCPVAQTFPTTVENKIKEISEIKDVTITLVWEPPWGPDRMSEAARLELNMF